MSIARRLTALLAATLLVAGCVSGRDGSPTLTVYSANGLGAWYSQQFEKFTEQTGIKVTLFEAGSGEVVSRVNSKAVWDRLDGDRPVPPADLLVTPPPFIQRAARAGILQPGGADTAGISSPLVDPGGLFVPIVGTALCFIANPAATPMPVSWDDLLRPDLKGKLQYSTPGEAGGGTAMLLLLQHLLGKPGALDYLHRLQVNNVGPSASTAALQPKVDSGELLIANGDVQMNAASIHNDGSRFTVFFPALQGTRTTISMPYIAAVTATSRRSEDAKRLLAHLLSDEAQRSVPTVAFGIPVRDRIAGENATAAPDTPAGYLRGVTMWTPDWDAVLIDLDRDLAAYKKATGT